MEHAKAVGTSPWRRLCRRLCQEQGGKDALMVAVATVVLGALALQLGLGAGASGPGGRDVGRSAALRT